jgi:hypothetical protein
MRLGGWQRIGIVLSVCWILVGGYWGNQVGLSEGDWVRARFAACLEARSIQTDGSVPKDTDWRPCDVAFDRDFPHAIRNHWYYAAVFAFIPIPLAWLLVYALRDWFDGFGLALRAAAAKSQRAYGRCFSKRP